MKKGICSKSSEVGKGRRHYTKTKSRLVEIPIWVSAEAAASCSDMLILDENFLLLMVGKK